MIGESRHPPNNLACRASPSRLTLKKQVFGAFPGGRRVRNGVLPGGQTRLGRVLCPFATSLWGFRLPWLIARSREPTL
jgi:hypothetical protein